MREIVVITHENYLKNEVELIKELAGRKVRFHLRKPGSSREDLSRFCEKITLSNSPEQFSLHKEPTVALQFGFLAHYSFSSLENNPNLEHGGFSCSTHTIEEAHRASLLGARYHFLSPIFNSISKSGYNAAFLPSTLASYHASRSKNGACVALGGVSLSNLELLSEFDSIALLGGVWSVENGVVDIAKTVENFNKIEQKWQKLKNYNI